MPKAVPLDKVLVQGTVYTTHEREVWVIKKLGTNSTTRGYLKIDNKETTYIHSTAAPLHKTSSNLLGPIDLGPLFLVVPQETAIEWGGASASKLRVIGTKLILSPGESIDASLLDRFNRQPSEYLVILEGTYSFGAATEWGAGVEVEALSLTPKTIERYVLDGVVMASVAGISGGVSEGMIAVSFYLDNNPLENIAGTNIYSGIDVISMPRPPAATTEFTPFTLENNPIAVEGDHTLSIRAKNVYGDKLSASGTMSVTVTAASKFYRRG